MGRIVGAHSLIADTQDEAATAAALKGRYFDVVINFIAFSGEDIARDLRLFQGNCGQYIFISSASAYQKPLEHSLISESTPLENPFWEYSRQKNEAEVSCMDAYAKHRFPVTIVRPSLTYNTVIPLIGCWNDFTVIDRMRTGRPVLVHGDGNSLWTITHAEDFAVGLVGLFGHERAIGEAFHITSDEVLTWNQIYDRVGLAAGVEHVKKVHVPSDFIVKMVPALTGSLLEDKAISAVFDNSKIKQFVPEFDANVSFKDGIQRTVQWFEADPALLLCIVEVRGSDCGCLLCLIQLPCRCLVVCSAKRAMRGVVGMFERCQIDYFQW
ncbi:MAG: nucleoside-diphosphate-sugar epimerase [Lentimonas sp.]|jgi:nucleoside-diphosphate-sugar epimerase